MKTKRALERTLQDNCLGFDDTLHHVTLVHLTPRMDILGFTLVYIQMFERRAQSRMGLMGFVSLTRSVPAQENSRNSRKHSTGVLGSNLGARKRRTGVLGSR